MPDIIQLLPDSVANQIAAGEVIQRPASAVKELLENSVDAGADNIQLVIKNAGKSLIQVIDNGCGMSLTDARMSFERHATSKIKEANDLFAIQTLGFRGEALASIAAIAKVELKTKRHEDETAAQLFIEGSKVINQSACAASNGTSISIKNLFFNVPARRKFLKTNTTELRHIIEEFQRVALVRPEISFRFINDNRQLFNLDKTGLKQRIVQLFGTSFNYKLVPVEQKSKIVNITGFIGKPEFARKTRGEQYFFVNNRYIKHPYLNHAIDNSFKELIPGDSFPSYFIYFKIDPREIDINIHPTKTEVNFQNNQIIYAMLSSAVKQALGKFNITPSIDFDSESNMNISIPPGNKTFSQPSVKIDPEYNPFKQEKNKESFSDYAKKRSVPANWQDLYHTDELINKSGKQDSDFPEIEFENTGSDTHQIAFETQNKLIVTHVKSGIMIIHKQRAYERIYFESIFNSLKSGKGVSQQSLFPIRIELSTGDAEVLNGILSDLKVLGFDIDYNGSRTFTVNGSPDILNNNNIKDVLDNIIENIKMNPDQLKADKLVSIAKAMSVNMAYQKKAILKEKEINHLINSLFTTSIPETSPNGKPVVTIIPFSTIDQKLN